MAINFKRPEYHGPVRHIKDTKHGEHLYLGQIKHISGFGSRSLYPLGGLVRLGDRGNLTFTVQNKFINYLRVDGDQKIIRFMEENSGIEIGGIRSFKTGAAEQLIKRAIVIAHYRKAKYIYLDTQNRRLENIVLNLGFISAGTNMVGQRVYIKLL